MGTERRKREFTSFQQESKAEGGEKWTPPPPPGQVGSQRALWMQLNQTPPAPAPSSAADPVGGGARGWAFLFLQERESSSSASPPWASAEKGEGAEDGEEAWGGGKGRLPFFFFFSSRGLCGTEIPAFWMVSSSSAPLPTSETPRHAPCSVLFSARAVTISLGASIPFS